MRLQHGERSAAAERVGQRIERVAVHPQLAQPREPPDVGWELRDAIALEAELVEAQQARQHIGHAHYLVAAEVQLLERRTVADQPRRQRYQPIEGGQHGAKVRVLRVGRGEGRSAVPLHLECDELRAQLGGQTPRVGVSIADDGLARLSCRATPVKLAPLCAPLELAQPPALERNLGHAGEAVSLQREHEELREGRQARGEDAQLVGGRIQLSE
mmetsp:Transcript_36726/g.115422  ORF Transcript_36726/g.115422 Transcript_36726/m.115422 type:complete len:214 (+) Transcript_36726:1016-1657(+)